MRILFIAALAAGLCSSAMAQISITAMDTPVSENFDSLGTAATAPLPSGWKVDSTAASPTTDYNNATLGTATTQQSYSAVVSAPTSGGVYNWGNGANTTTERALGWLGSGTLTSPRQAMVRVVNNTGATINQLTVSFDYEKYRSGTRAWNMTFFGGADGSTWTSYPAGDQSYTADANNTTMSNPPLSAAKTVVIGGLSIANGNSFYLRWNYAGAGGNTNAQGLAIDNLSVVGSTSTWGLSSTSVQFTDGAMTTVDQANGPFNRTVTVSFLEATQLAQPTVTAPFSLLNPASDFTPTYTAGQSLDLQLRYTPTVNDGALATQAVTITATTGAPGSAVLTLSGRTVKEVTLAGFKSEAEAGSAAGIVYKFAGIVGTTTIQASRNQLSVQDRADGDSATRGLIVDDAAATGSGGTMPSVGDTVTLYGTYTNYRGLVQVTPDRAYARTPSGTSIVPVQVNSTQLSDATEGVLLEIPNTTTTAGSYLAGANIPANDGSGFIIRIQTGAGFGFASSGSTHTVRAVGGQFHSVNTNINSGGDGYQLQAFDPAFLPVTVSHLSLD